MPSPHVDFKQLREAHAINWAALARRYGFHKSLFSHVIAGRRKNPVVRSAIASAVGLKPEQIWPDAKPRNPGAA